MPGQANAQLLVNPVRAHLALAREHTPFFAETRAGPYRSRLSVLAEALRRRAAPTAIPYRLNHRAPECRCPFHIFHDGLPFPRRMSHAICLAAE